MSREVYNGLRKSVTVSKFQCWLRHCYIAAELTAGDLTENNEYFCCVS